MTDRQTRRAIAVARLRVLRRLALIMAAEMLVLLVLLVSWGVRSVKASRPAVEAQEVQTVEAAPEEAADTPVETTADSGDNSTFTVITAQDAAARTQAEETTPTPEPTPEEDDSYPVIELFGDTQEYSAVYRVGDTVYELYGYSESAAQTYTDAVNEVAAELKGVCDVYCMVIPTSAGITVPDELWDAGLAIGNEEEPYQEFMDMLSDDVKAVPIFDTLMRHRDEYIYFRTDHHWTQLGAYYAYVEFCKTKGIEYHELEEYPVQTFDNFLGTFYDSTNQNAEVGANPDYIDVYGPLSQTATMDITMTDGSTGTDMSVIFDESQASSGLKYGCFIAGDNAFTEITNPEVTDGSSCVVIKESFGNAFVPLLVDHYSTVYVVDYRYWQGSVPDFIRENGVDDLIFANNISSLRGTGAVAAIISVL